VQDSALTGPIVVVAVLVAATAFGLWHRRRDGQLRPVIGQPTEQVATVPVRRTTERIAPGPAAVSAHPDPVSAAGVSTAGVSAAGVLVDPSLLTALGVQLGTPATLLQFSSAFCAPCRATRRVLGEVTGLLDGVRHVEVDAESQLAAVRTLNIWRTPTVLVLDADGRIVHRASGVPGKAQVIAALAPLLTGAAR
jgi:thiol-disulfide isomerase/thioredoxin